MLYMQVCGFCLLTLVMQPLGGWGHLFDGSGWRPWAWGILAGLLNTTSTLALYRSFEIGKLSIVAPVSASYPVLTMLLSAMTGERLTPVRLVGLLLTIAGVVLVARGEHVPQDANPIDAETQPAKKRLGVGWAIVSALGFGVMFWLLGLRVVPLLGSAPSVWTIRLTSVFATALAMMAFRQSLAAPPQRDAPWIFGVGLLDTSAYVFNNFGMQHEQTSVVSVLASLYGAVTVALAALFLRESVSRLQWLGIVAIFVGITLISR
jgi:drug/metabolite transporter (DMT)-like permease